VTNANDGRPLMRRSVWIGTATTIAVSASGCTVLPSSLQPNSTSTVTRGGWDAAFVLALLAVLAIVVLFAVALRRRGRRAPGSGGGTGLVVVAGVVLPIVAIAGLSVVTVLGQRRATQNAQAPIRIQVEAHQWWWAITYEETGVVTANQLTIPSNTEVQLSFASDNVVHSFWVPSLTPAIDVIPGTEQYLTLEVPTPGTYRGQCAQFCGLGHADMRILVNVVPPADFDAWQQHEVQLIQDDASGGTPAGLGVFFVAGCDRCHTIQGTIADGTVGPDLTDVGAREMLGANIVHNDPGSLGRWISDPSSIKPGVKMPGYGGVLSPQQIGALVHYLEGLR
jgi:cytochrome c oxidase subunit 2